MAGTGTWRKFSNKYLQTTNPVLRSSCILFRLKAAKVCSMSNCFCCSRRCSNLKFSGVCGASFDYPAAGKTLGLAVVTACHQDFPFLPGSKWFFCTSWEHHIRMTPLKETFMRFVKSFYEIFMIAITVHKIGNDICWWFTASFEPVLIWKKCDPFFRREKFDKSFRCWPEEFLFTSLQYFEIHPKWWCFTQGANGYIGFMTWPLLETICPPELLQNMNDFPYAWPPLPCIHHTWWYPSAKIQITLSSWTLNDTPKCYLNMIVNLCNCQTASILSIRIVSLNLCIKKE